jgi:hypothetical protein
MTSPHFTPSTLATPLLLQVKSSLLQVDYREREYDKNTRMQSSNTISFDEFQAALLADRATAAAKQQSNEETSSTMKKLQYFIERPNTQIVMLFFIYLDVIAMIFSNLLTSQSSGWWSIIGHLCAVVFIVELLMHAILFRIRFFVHYGFLIDTMLVSARIARDCAMVDMSVNQLILINLVLRIWRFVRLLNTFITNEQQKHIVTKNKLKEWKEKALQFEETVKICNEEVTTLREALNIAAKDVAAAMMGKFNHDLSQFAIDNKHENDDALKGMQVIVEDSSMSD